VRGSPPGPLDGTKYLLSKEESPARYMMGLFGLSERVVAWKAVASGMVWPFHSK
jgi:hypothetical protein